MDKKNRLFKILLIAQASYSLITALWGIIDINSFMAVTGPKTDIWLVKTVSALIIPISLCLLSYVFIKTNILPAIVLGVTSAAGLAIIDFYYSGQNVISDIYMMDGGIQILFIVCWIIIMMQRRSNYKEN